MAHKKNYISPELLFYPTYKTENGINYKLDHYNMTDDGTFPVYVETEEISEEEAFSILLGEEE